MNHVHPSLMILRTVSVRSGCLSATIISRPSHYHSTHRIIGVNEILMGMIHHTVHLVVNKRDLSWEARTSEEFIIDNMRVIGILRKWSRIISSSADNLQILMMVAAALIVMIRIIVIIREMLAMMSLKHAVAGRREIHHHRIVHWGRHILLTLSNNWLLDSLIFEPPLFIF